MTCTTTEWRHYIEEMKRGAEKERKKRPEVGGVGVGGVGYDGGGGGVVVMMMMMMMMMM